MNHTSVNNYSPSIPRNFEVALTQESRDLFQRLKGINSRFFFQTDKKIKKQLNEVSYINLTSILQHLFAEMVEEGDMADPTPFLERLAAIIPLEKMQEVNENSLEGILQEAADMFGEAKHYLETSCQDTPFHLRQRLASIFSGIVTVIESIIAAFGLADFFRPAEDEIQAQTKFHKIMILLSFFSMMTSMFLPLLGATMGKLVIGGTLLAISALSLVWPLLKPKTTHLPAHAENWTTRVQKEGFTAQGRKESLDEIANILTMGRHALLVGPSRVGKSLTAKAFAQAIKKGDYPGLKGKTVFRINTADIVGQQPSFRSDGNNVLQKISDTMGRHRGNIILVLDEVHMACKNNEKIADQLKTFLDEGGEFPHVIGITTEEEYTKHVKNNQAFSLRFDHVAIKNTSRDETLKILGDTLLRSRSNPLIAEDALEQIYDKSCERQEAPQPAAAIRLLKQCINRTEKTQKSPIEQKIIEISNAILSQQSQAAATRGKRKDVHAKIADLKRQLHELQTALSVEKSKSDKLFKAKHLINQLTKENYARALKISTLAGKSLNSKEEKQLKTFLLVRDFLDKSLEPYIIEEAKDLGIKPVIDKELIESFTN